MPKNLGYKTSWKVTCRMKALLTVHMRREVALNYSLNRHTECMTDNEKSTVRLVSVGLAQAHPTHVRSRLHLSTYNLQSCNITVQHLTKLYQTCSQTLSYSACIIFFSLELVLHQYLHKFLCSYCKQLEGCEAWE